MRIAGLDVGEARVGVAVSDELGLTAQGIGVVWRRGLARDLEALAALLSPYEPERLVVGHPLRQDGSSGPAAQRARSFGAAAAERLGIPFELWDERFSTIEAERVLLAADLSRRRRREVIDKVAAVVILQAYLDAKRR